MSAIHTDSSSAHIIQGLFWVGACVPVGRLQSDDIDDMYLAPVKFNVTSHLSVMLACTHNVSAVRHPSAVTVNLHTVMKMAANAQAAACMSSFLCAV